MRRPPIKRDKTHAPIRDGLIACGVEVCEIFEPVDLLCHAWNFTALIEAKVNKKDAPRYTRKQLTFIANTKMNVAFAETAEEAFEIMKYKLVLADEEKHALVLMLRKATKDRFTPKDIETALCSRR